ncbi:MAG: hypothetical protein H0V82_07650 [Candidatus Protochlamydia sp.]|nr:hypothetical protein [Candidatus Protochlamydia sp.]
MKSISRRSPPIPSHNTLTELASEEDKIGHWARNLPSSASEMAVDVIKQLAEGNIPPKPPSAL